MNDPHVVSLRYELVTGAELVFDNPPPIHRETDNFSMTLADGEVEFVMKEHFASKALAKAVVQDFLLSWEIYTKLQTGCAFTFLFKDANIIDRNPPRPGDSVWLSPEPVSGVASVTGTLYMRSNTYPELPSDFEATPDVETLWNRYNGSIQGRETGKGLIGLQTIVHYLGRLPPKRSS
ncbi:MAG: hypothetical protein L0312_13480 [Acidobacteria bacterium]|nr:hypothetical protein [Acidobacteriota bacterium]